MDSDASEVKLMKSSGTISKGHQRKKSIQRIKKPKIQPVESPIEISSESEPNVHEDNDDGDDSEGNDDNNNHNEDDNDNNELPPVSSILGQVAKRRRVKYIQSTDEEEDDDIPIDNLDIVIPHEDSPSNEIEVEEDENNDSVMVPSLQDPTMKPSYKNLPHIPRFAEVSPFGYDQNISTVQTTDDKEHFNSARMSISQLEDIMSHKDLP
ncbi:hypothetical protein H0H81_006212 [Sphagnurus paluster]|uniref:Uncharacterized protein n=3 Tax=Sphagnurus paluster TaxID=117069 RepID=A0A9P7KGX8_9AGAR|nr:hypothetical protein H0H81_006212 [Sphagnurus paluster]